MLRSSHISMMMVLARSEISEKICKHTFSSTRRGLFGLKQTGTTHFPDSTSKVERIFSGTVSNVNDIDCFFWQVGY